MASVGWLTDPVARTHRNRVLKIRTAGKYANDQYGLAAQLQRAVKKADKAKIRAVAGLKRRALPAAKRLVTQNYGIPKSKIKDRVRVRTTPVTLSVDASQLRFALSEFGGKWGGPKTPGATAAVVRGERKTYQHAFIRPGRLRGSEAQLIYTRTGRYATQKHGRYAGKRREVIAVNRGPSTKDMLTGHRPDGVVVGADLRTPLGHELIDYYISELHRLYALADV